MTLTIAHMKRYRGTILTLLNINHKSQNSRLDHVTLALSMRGLGCSVGEYDVLTLLQDLHDRSYVKYDERRNKKTDEVSIWKIEILPAGRDVLEGTIEDPAVEV